MIFYLYLNLYILLLKLDAFGFHNIYYKTLKYNIFFIISNYKQIYNYKIM